MKMANHIGTKSLPSGSPFIILHIHFSLAWRCAYYLIFHPMFLSMSFLSSHVKGMCKHCVRTEPLRWSSGVMTTNKELLLVLVVCYSASLHERVYYYSPTPLPPGNMVKVVFHELI